MAFCHEKMKRFKKMEYRVDQHGDTTITIRKIKIKNIEKWDKMSTDEIYKTQECPFTKKSFANHRDTEYNIFKRKT